MMNTATPMHGRNVTPEFLAERAKFVRLETLRLARICGAGHYSSTFSAAELFVALYYAHLRLNPAQPKWPDRDRFILSKGHAAIGLYPILADLGYFDAKLLDNYTRLGSPFGDHPDMKKIPGVDFSSGSLGHGLSIGLGMALAGRVQKRGYRVYCMLGDGELAEGQIWEAAMAAGHFRLQGLVGIVDRNQLCIDGPTEEIMKVEPLVDRFRSFGWEVQRIDGHDFAHILDALDGLKPAGEGRPQMIIADTIKGRGVARMELSLDWHVANLVGQDYEDAIAEIEGGLKPRARETCMAEARTRPQAQEQDAIFRGTGGGDVSLKDKASVQGTPARLLPAFVLGEELADLADRDPRIVVLTADLASANRTKDFKLRHADRFFDFGIAEKNMITAAAGMAAAGHVVYAATFAAFSALLGAEQIRTDCAYPRMPVRVIGHHSGMSMGFYGTSHHALEDLAMMRTIAELTVVCAADANQLRAILRASVEHPGAMYIRLGRGRDPEVYPAVPGDFRFGQAATLRDGRDLTIVATGSVMRVVLDAAAVLAGEGRSVRVLDMHTIKPLDAEAVQRAARETAAILTVEEHNVTGGLGSAVADVLVDCDRVPFRKHGVPDEFVPVGPPAALYAHYRLDAPGIAAVARELLAAGR